MLLRDLGEFPLIERLTAGLERAPDVALGAGDDAAVLAVPPEEELVATCDAQVEGQHFVLGVASPIEIGHKALAVTLSDLAAMGARPRWALVSLVASPALPVALLDGVYAGMRALAREFAVSIVGGNVAATAGPLTLDVTLLGTCPRGQALRRDGARRGDALMLVGDLGAAAAGVLASISAPGAAEVPPDALERARLAMAAPRPLVAQGLALARGGAVSALLDISDGLAQDLAHLCARSHVGAIVEAAALPVDDATRAIAAAYGRDPLALALGGGEDYALLCAIRPEGIEPARVALRALGSEAMRIGDMTGADEGVRLRLPNGDVAPLAPRGWDHLRARG